MKIEYNSHMKNNIDVEGMPGAWYGKLSQDQRQQSFRDYVANSGKFSTKKIFDDDALAVDPALLFVKERYNMGVVKRSYLAPAQEENKFSPYAELTCSWSGYFFTVKASESLRSTGASFNTKHTNPHYFEWDGRGAGITVDYRWEEDGESATIASLRLRESGFKSLDIYDEVWKALVNPNKPVRVKDRERIFKKAPILVFDNNENQIELTAEFEKEQMRVVTASARRNIIEDMHQYFPPSEWEDPFEADTQADKAWLSFHARRVDVDWTGLTGESYKKLKELAGIARDPNLE